jgi:glycyl-tRNA synthetase beta chain
LKRVVFQRKLGSVHDKTLRVATLAEALAVQIGAEAGIGARAGMLSKCDLLTDLVKEFPELQGTMGRYYALHDGESALVADAMEEQYLPRFAGDGLPLTAVGQSLAVADKVDTLIALFGIGQPPSGAKDPFGLRRAALGVLRIIIENGLDIDLIQTLDLAVEGFPDDTLAKGCAGQVYDYMMERLRAYYLDRGAKHDEFEAVLVLRPAKPLDFDRRLQAVREFRQFDAAASLAAANKRIANILRKAGDTVPDRVDPALFVEAEETALYEQTLACREQADALLASGDYAGSLAALAGLREVVDRFFDEVMVMAEDKALRGNRLALLTTLRALFLQVADVSKLQD